MIAIMLGILLDHKDKIGLNVVDYGCGYGYSTLALGMLLGSKVRVVGKDVYPEFVEKARINRDKYKMENVEFKVGDFMEEEEKGVDLLNLGFEVSMQKLEERKHILNDNAVILAPISTSESLE